MEVVQAMEEKAMEAEAGYGAASDACRNFRVTSPEMPQTTSEEFFLVFWFQAVSRERRAAPLT